LRESVGYWLDLAEYDFDTARAMLIAGKFFYVGFMCHQTIEKALKAVISSNLEEGDIPPKIHDLVKLAVRSDLFSIMSDDQKKFIDYLNPLNIEARYPENKTQLIELLTVEKCEAILSGTDEFLCWIKNQL